MSTPVFDRIGRLVGRITGEVDDENLSDNVALKDADNVYTGKITVTLADFADDAAAAVGGIAVGQLYRNGSVVQVRVS